MIIGQFEQKITDKYRIALPAKFREDLGNKLIITKGYEGCLIIISPARWEELIRGVSTGPFVSKDIRDTSRFLLASASEIELDSQRRFVLPDYLRQYAKLAQNGIFLGLGRWVELRANQLWMKKQKEVEDQSSLIGEKLANL